jgi:hypothetical protein
MSLDSGASDRYVGFVFIHNSTPECYWTWVPTYDAALYIYDLGYPVKVQADGDVQFLYSYSSTIGGTNIDLQMDNTGMIGPTPCDPKLKKNIRPLDNSDKIYELNPIRFDRKDGTGTNLVGFDANEVAQVMPEAVGFKRVPIMGKVPNPFTGKDANEVVGFETTDEAVSLSMTKLIPALVKEIQNLNDRLTAAEAEIEKLKAASPTPIPSSNGFADPVALGILATVGFLMWLINRRKVAR